MTAPLLVPYRGALPTIGDATCAAETAIIGNTRLGRNARLERLVTLRGDGHNIVVGDDCTFLDRATVHIADAKFPTHIGDRVLVGRFALVHACTISDDCVIGDAAVIMDNSKVGPGAVFASGALVPPGKELDGGWLYDGNPAKPVREVTEAERTAWRQALMAGDSSTPVCGAALPPLETTPYLPADAGPGPCHALGTVAPQINPESFVAATAAVIGDVVTTSGASIWFATVMRGDGARITVGERSNVQDNSILETTAARGPITIGEDVTIGHNVRIGSCIIGDRALVGMGAEVGDGVVLEEDGIIGARALVEPGTVIKAGYVWAGRPAREFRPVKPEEAAFFKRGCEVYVGYNFAYLEEAA